MWRQRLVVCGGCGGDPHRDFDTNNLSQTQIYLQRTCKCTEIDIEQK